MRDISNPVTQKSPEVCDSEVHKKTCIKYIILIKDSKSI